MGLNPLKLTNKLLNFGGPGFLHGLPFSLADIKTENFNELMLDLFLSKFHINHNLEINKKAVKDIRKYGLIAA